MALSTVDVPSDDSDQDDSEGSESLAWANGTPVERAPKRGSGPSYDARVLEALRRVSALERERSEANRALNSVISHSLDLERRLADSQAALEATRTTIRTYLQEEIARLGAENDEIHARVATLQASIFWRIGVAVRSARGRLRKRG